MDLSLEVARRLSDADRDAAAALLARAFRDNPLNRAVIRSARAERRERANRHGMRALLPAALGHGYVGVARSGDRPAGVLIAAEPGGFPLPPPALVLRVRCALGQGLRVAGRWAECFERLAALHPPWPHAYLATLGVDPARQGRGAGRALLDAWLASLDARGLPAYLETDLPRNVGFYRRGGFEVSGDTQVLGVCVWRMQRPPC